MGLLRRPTPDLRDYLYVDERRLNSYLEQFSDTDTYDKVRVGEVGLGPTGPSYRNRAEKHRRPKTQHARVAELLSYLQRTGKVSGERPCWVNDSREDIATPRFRLEQCDATRVLVPCAERAGAPSEGVMIWVSPWPLDRRNDVLRRPGVLCLIEDASHDERSHRTSFSSYTWVLSLLHQLTLQPTTTLLGGQYLSNSSGEYTFHIMAPGPQVWEESDVFRRDPLGWLAAKGCKVSPQPRRIEVLYQLRNVAVDDVGIRTEPDFTISTFAYAIAIWAAS